MKKLFEFLKPKKSKYVEELKKEFDKKLEAQEKSNTEYLKEKSKRDTIFKSLMNDDFYSEINELMKHYEKKNTPLTRGHRCGYKIDNNYYTLNFYGHSHDNFPIEYRFISKENKISVSVPGNDSLKDKNFAIKDSREAEKYFLKQVNKHLADQI
jgi:hypothetical protein